MKSLKPLVPDTPLRWVSRFASLIPAGHVLDLACGGGRHARFLASLARQVMAVDRDADTLVAVQHAAELTGVAIITRRLDQEAQDASRQAG